MIRFVHYCGGGYTVLSYIGVVRYFEMHPEDVYELYDISGTSAGAVFAFLVCIGFCYKDFINFVFSYYDELSNVFRFHDISSIETNGCVVQIEKLWYILHVACKRYEIDLQTLTFASLHERSHRLLTITSTCLNTRSCEHFNVFTRPDMYVLQALQISTCIPLLFRPILFDNKYYVDGALTDCISEEYLIIRSQNYFNNDTFNFPNTNFFQYLSTFYNTIIGIITSPKASHKFILINQTNFFSMLNRNDLFCALMNGFNSTENFFKKNN